MSRYDPQWITNYFDEDLENEWERLTKTPTSEIKLFIHTHYLKRYVRCGDLVLEVGAGAGRFTQILVESGAKVVVADISENQLNLNRKYATELKFAEGIKNWLQLDVCQMNQLENYQFDAVVCYGGPLSYVFDRRTTALQEMLRVLKPNGKILISVMSLWGSIRKLLPRTLESSVEDNTNLVTTGDLCPQNLQGATQRCHLFRATELAELLENYKTKVIAMSASNCLSADWGAKLLEVRQNATKWNKLLKMELEASREPGCLDLGTHLIAVAEKAF